MKKESYEYLEMETIAFENEDIVTISGPEGDIVTT